MRTFQKKQQEKLKAHNKKFITKVRQSKKQTIIENKVRQSKKQTIIENNDDPYSDAKTLIKRWEGLRLVPYQDPIGLWTVGYGHLMGDGKTKPMMDKITQAEADTLFDDDFHHHRALMQHYVKKTARRRSTILIAMNPYQIGAVTSLVYNIGAGRFAASTICRLLADGDWDAAEQQFHLWRRAGGKILKGLVNRRREEADLFRRAYQYHF